MKMNIIEFDYDKEAGFAWILLDNDISVQCCLDQPGGTPAHQHPER